MLNIRIRKDGVREARTEDAVYEIPHEHEIAAEPLFAHEARRTFFVDPRFMSIGSSDMDHVDARLRLAAARDLEVIGAHFPKISGLLENVADILRSRACSMIPPAVIASIESDLERLAHPIVPPSVGPDFEDSIWLAGLDIEIEAPSALRDNLARLAARSRAGRARERTHKEETAGSQSLSGPAVITD